MSAAVAAIAALILAPAAALLALAFLGSRDDTIPDVRARVLASTPPRPVLVHAAPAGGELLEFPVAAGWDEDEILDTLADIEAL